jgi:arsenate reductase
MAEGFLRKLAGERFESCSAGLDPKKKVHPLAVKAMDEIGIDISSQKPKSVSAYLGKETIFYIIVVCEKAQQSCPRIWPGLGAGNRYYWPFEDPANAEGTDEKKMEAFRRVRDGIKAKLIEWIDEHLNP